MAVGVGIVAECHIVAITQLDQVRHRVRRRAVHSDLAVVVDGHEPEGGIHRGLHHGQIQSVALGNRSPIPDARSAHWVDAQAEARATDPLEVEHGGEVLDIGAHEVVSMRGDCADCLSKGHPSNLEATVGEVLIGELLDALGQARIGGSAVGRIVLEPPVTRGIVTRSDDDAVGAIVPVFPIVP